MTTEERLAVVETEVRHLKEDLAEANRKLDQLVRAANMGQGAWWASVKIGGLVVMTMGAIGWVIDHLPRVWK